MLKKINSDYKNRLHLFIAVFFLFFFILPVSQTVFAQFDPLDNPYLVERLWTKGGRQIDKVIFPGRPPKFYRAPAAKLPEPNIAKGINVLSNVPAFDWSYGCSATSGAMMAGYYDNNGFPNMYAGPENGGVCPMTNEFWYPGECPLSATQQGYDGLATFGHVDDYWVAYESTDPDPWIGNWAEHAYADCTGDFMKTNQSSYDNTDGSTTFFYYPDGSPTTYADLVAEGAYGPMGTYADYDGGCGLADFFTSRGYTWTAMYNQYIEEVVAGGFTFAQFKAEIDAGRPVLIHVLGHTMLGYGYNDTPSSTIYIHNTWDYSDYTMTWGGYYDGLLHLGVTVIELEPTFAGVVLFDEDSYAAPDTAIITVWDSDLDTTGNADTTTVGVESILTTDTEIMELTETGASTGIFTVDVGIELDAVAVTDSILQVLDSDTIIVTYVDEDHDGGGTPATLTDTAVISLVTTPVGLITTSGGNYVFLYWNAVESPVLDGYNVYRSTSLGGAKTRANGATLVTANSFQDIFLSADTTYYYWVTAQDTYGNETDYSSVAMVTTGLGGEDGENGDGEDDGDGTSSSSDNVGSLSNCFIATASYGTPMAKEVIMLSQFRDEYLLNNALGKLFITTYYKTSPKIASFISKHPHLKSLVRWSLKPMVKVTGKVVEK